MVKTLKPTGPEMYTNGKQVKLDSAINGNVGKGGKIGKMVQAGSAANKVVK